MTGDDIKPDPDKLDPDGLKDALGRTGRMLKTAGLPFEEDEFDEDETGSSDFEQAEGVDSSALARGVDAGEPVGGPADTDADADDDSSSSSSEDGDSSSSSSAE